VVKNKKKPENIPNKQQPTSGGVSLGAFSALASSITSPTPESAKEKPASSAKNVKKSGKKK